MRHFKHNFRGNKLASYQAWLQKIQFVEHFKHDFRVNNLWQISRNALGEIMCETFQAKCYSVEISSMAPGDTICGTSQA